MSAPSKSFTVIADSAIDADSPLTEDLMEDLRDNDVHLEEWLGKNYTAAVDHDHDGVNSKAVLGNPPAQQARAPEDGEDSTSATSYATVETYRFYVAVARADFSVRGSYQIKTSTSSADSVQARLLIDGATAAAETAERTNGTYAWVDAVSAGVTLSAGWHTVEVQYKRVNHGSAETAYISGYAWVVR